MLAFSLTLSLYIYIYIYVSLSLYLSLSLSLSLSPPPYFSFSPGFCPSPPSSCHQSRHHLLWGLLMSSPRLKLPPPGVPCLHDIHSLCHRESFQLLGLCIAAAPYVKQIHQADTSPVRVSVDRAEVRLPFPQEIAVVCPCPRRMSWKTKKREEEQSKKGKNEENKKKHKGGRFPPTPCAPTSLGTSQSYSLLASCRHRLALHHGEHRSASHFLWVEALKSMRRSARAAACSKSIGSHRSPPISDPHPPQGTGSRN